MFIFMDFLLVLGSLKEYAICFSQRAQRRREYQPPAQQVQGAGRGVDESESIAPIAASAASRMSSRRESAASRKRLAKASRRKWGKGGRGLRGSVGRVMGRVFFWGGGGLGV